MSLNQLSRLTGIVAEALRDAERRQSFDHFTVEQMKRIDDALELDLMSGFRSQDGEDEPPRKSRVFQPEERLTDAATSALWKIADEEAAAGRWSEFANQDPPALVVGQLLARELLESHEGQIRLVPEVFDSLSPVLDGPDGSERVTWFSSEFVRTMAKSLAASRA